MSRKLTVPDFYTAVFEKANRKIHEIPSNYDTLKQFNLHEALLEDAEYKCVYCQKKIDVGHTTIEHWVCQSHNKSLRADPGNLFATCNSKLYGNPKLLHCQQARARGNPYFFPFFMINLTQSNLQDFVEINLWEASNLPLQFIQAVKDSNRQTFTGEIEASSFLKDHIKSSINYAINECLALNEEKLNNSRLYELSQLIQISKTMRASLLSKIQEFQYSDFLNSALRQTWKLD